MCSNAQAVRELLPYASCVDLMRKAMRLVAQGRARQPIRQMVAQTDGRGVLGWMPGYTDDPPWLGVKIVTVFPGNFGTAHGSHQGMVLLFETKNGAPKAIVEAREITAIRTAAATAVGTDVLARKTVKTLGLFGYGDQAHAHARAVPLVRKFDEILVWGRDFNRAHSFANELQGEVPCAIRAVKQAQEAAEADVVCTLTASAVPVFQTQWLKPGHHLNLVGSSVPTACEVEPELVRRARYFTDYPDSARVLAAEFLRAREQGLVGDEHLLGGIGDVLEGKVPGRTSDTDITVFKSLGMVAEDLVSADFVLSEAQRRDVGQVVEW